MSTQHQSSSMGDELTNILMVGLAALFGLIFAALGDAGNGNHGLAFAGVEDPHAAGRA